MDKQKSNINIKSNIYPKEYVRNEKDFYRVLPGHILYTINPSYFDVRILKLRTLAPPRYRLPTDRQLEEYRRKLICCICGKPCAGLCELDKNS